MMVWCDDIRQWFLVSFDRLPFWEFWKIKLPSAGWIERYFDHMIKPIITITSRKFIIIWIILFKKLNYYSPWLQVLNYPLKNGRLPSEVLFEYIFCKVTKSKKFIIPFMRSQSCLVFKIDNAAINKSVFIF